jgi:biopolymer transport protein ExbD
MKLESTLRPNSGLLFAAPMLDAVLLLLVFFVLSSNFVVKSGIPVDLPVSSSILPPISGSHIITVLPGSSPRLFFNEQEIAFADLEAALDKDKASPDRRHVVILADRTAAFGVVMKISEAVTSRGFDLAYATMQYR